MQKQTKVILGSVLLLTSGFYAITRLTAQEEGLAEGQAKVVYESPTHVVFDVKTWEVIGPDPDASEYDLLNDAESVFQRSNAALSATSPSDYEQLYPRSPEQKQAIEAAIFQISHPQTVEESRGQMTPEQLEKEDASWFSILHPIEAYEAMQNPPSQEAVSSEEAAPQ